MQLTSSSPEATERVGALVAGELASGEVVTVAGELGTGKTVFIRGACHALGVTERVTSPTFTIGHRYRGRVDVSHLDLYRFGAVSPAEWGDLEPYFDGAIVFVEWPGAGTEALPRARVAVTIEHVDPTHRRIALESEESALLERIWRSVDPRA